MQGVLPNVDLEEKVLSYHAERHAERSRNASGAVRDFYRCAESAIEFSLNGTLSPDQGYFRVGEKITGYGHASLSSLGNREASNALRDALDEVVFNNGQLKLPFDPDEVIENLRREHYAYGDKFWNGSARLLKELYYILRPLMAPSMRRRLQKFRSRGWKKLTFPNWPVDTTVENLCEKLLLLSMEAKGINRVPFVWFWPAGARGCVVMTHDVETRAGMEFCGELMDLDDSYGIKACFNVVPESRYPVSRVALQNMQNRGFEVGVQDFNHDGRLFDEREEFLRRATKINRYAMQWGASGFRAGVLYRRPEWFDALNISFDMSIPNVAHLDPQRGGCCTVMPYFIGDVLEIPVTTIQDYGLFHLLGERSIDLWKAQIELILEKNGLVSFIIHPDYIIEREERSVFAGLLDHLRTLREQSNTWFALPSDVDLWWRARSRMSVEKTGNSWRVVGEGAERAALAYAVRRDGKLVYEIPDRGANQFRRAVPRLSNHAHC